MIGFNSCNFRKIEPPKRRRKKEERNEKHDNKNKKHLDKTNQVGCE